MADFIYKILLFNFQPLYSAYLTLRFWLYALDINLLKSAVYDVILWHVTQYDNKQKGAWLQGTHNHRIVNHIYLIFFVVIILFGFFNICKYDFWKIDACILNNYRWSAFFFFQFVDFYEYTSHIKQTQPNIIYFIITTRK